MSAKEHITAIEVEGHPKDIVADLTFILSQVLESMDKQTDGKVSKEKTLDMITAGTKGWWKHKKDNKTIIDLDELSEEQLEKIKGRLGNILNALQGLNEETDVILKKMKEDIEKKQA